jgi:hypothetical protein
MVPAGMTRSIQSAIWDSSTAEWTGQTARQDYSEFFLGRWSFDLKGVGVPHQQLKLLGGKCHGAITFRPEKPPLRLPFMTKPEALTIINQVT